MDTIFALASGQVRAGIAVIRISGPDAHEAAQRLAGPLPPHGRSLRRLRDASGLVLDEALVLTFGAGHSFTGEPVVELHVHGSIAVTAAVLRTLGCDPLLRPAVAGEFTRRAMENGRLDLAQVEGLADLIDAETEAQRRQAMRVLSGAMGERAESWRQRLIRAAALIEATIDFVDEDVPVDVGPEVTDLLSGVSVELRGEAAGVRVAERVRDGFEVAIIGAPNVGKSSLLNILSGRAAAITSEIAGTTRDVIEVRMDIEGLPVLLLDTAGLRESADVVEQIGMARARERAEAADLRIHMLLPGQQSELSIRQDDIVVSAKGDLGVGEGIVVSAMTGQGVDDLVAAVAEVLRGRVAGIGVAMRERHRVAMNRASEHLDVAVQLMNQRVDASEILAEEVRTAVRCIDSLVGRVDVEDILDEVFASFCIGK